MWRGKQWFFYNLFFCLFSEVLWFERCWIVFDAKMFALVIQGWMPPQLCVFVCVFVWLDPVVSIPIRMSHQSEPLINLLLLQSTGKSDENVKRAVTNHSMSVWTALLTGERHWHKVCVFLPVSYQPCHLPLYNIQHLGGALVLSLPSTQKVEAS